MSAFVTASKTSSTAYAWSVPSYTGRVNRSQSVWVQTTTSPIVSASTQFIQNGSAQLNYVSGVPTAAVGSSAGTLKVICTTNVPSVQTHYRVAADTCGLQYQGSNIIGGGSIISTSVQDVDRLIETMTFTGDPGASQAFQFCVTYSYGANTDAYEHYGTIHIYSGSYTVSYVLTQSGASGYITVNPTTVGSISAKGGSGSIAVSTNDSNWIIVGQGGGESGSGNNPGIS